MDIVDALEIMEEADFDNLSYEEKKALDFLLRVVSNFVYEVE